MPQSKKNIKRALSSEIADSSNSKESTPEITSLLVKLIDEVSLFRIEYKTNQERTSKQIQNLQNLVNDIHHSAGLTRPPSFNSLPQEIRLKIWEFAALAPRIIGVQLYKCVPPNSDGNDRDGNDSHKEPIPKMVLTPTGPPSALLLVNNEARKVAMKSSETFGSRARDVPILRWNSNIDTLWVVNLCEWMKADGTMDLVPLLQLERCRGRQRLAIPLLVWQRTLSHMRRRGETDIGAMLLIIAFKHLPRLEEVILVVGDCEVVSRCGDIKWKRPSNIAAYKEFEAFMRKHRVGDKSVGSVLRLEELERALDEELIRQKRSFIELVTPASTANSDTTLREWMAWTPPKLKVRTAVSAREEKDV
jgi:hypothetical protein